MREMGLSQGRGNMEKGMGLRELDLALHSRPQPSGAPAGGPFCFEFQIPLLQVAQGSILRG